MGFVTPSGQEKTEEITTFRVRRLGAAPAGRREPPHLEEESYAGRQVGDSRRVPGHAAPPTRRAPPRLPGTAGAGLVLPRDLPPPPPLPGGHCLAPHSLRTIVPLSSSLQKPPRAGPTLTSTPARLQPPRPRLQRNPTPASEGPRSLLLAGQEPGSPPPPASNPPIAGTLLLAGLTARGSASPAQGTERPTAPRSGP